VELVGTDTTSGLSLLNGGILEVGPGYTLSNFTVSKGITLDVLSGGTANGVTVKGGGLEIVSDGGFEHGATVSSGGTFAAIGSAQVGGDTFLGGAVVEFGSGFAHPIAGAPLSGVAVQFLSCPAARSAAARPSAPMW
jgi:autotransporter passenger strand-loop-strand repeat protein